MRISPAFSIVAGKPVPQLPKSVIPSPHHVGIKRASALSGWSVTDLLAEWASVYSRIFS